MGALDVQVGGSHYKSGVIQPIEFAEANNMVGSDPSILKYILRHRKKNGAEDIKKVIHYFEILIDTVHNREWKFFSLGIRKSVKLKISLDELLECYDLNSREELLLKRLMMHRNASYITGRVVCLSAIAIAKKLLKEEYGVEY